MKFEINKELVLSTAHISNETLNGFVVEHDIHHSSDSYSSRFKVDFCLDYYKTEGLVLPEDLISLLKIAKENDCKWLVLDCDGDEVEGLPTFEW